MNCGGTVGVPPKWRQQCQENSGVASWVFRTFRGSKGKVGFLSRRLCAKGPHIGLRGEFPGVSRVSTGNLGFLLSYDWDLRDPLVLPQESQVSMRVERGLSGFLSCWCRVLGPHLELRPEPQGSSPVQTWISVFLWSFNRGVRPRLV